MWINDRYYVIVYYNIIYRLYMYEQMRGIHTNNIIIEYSCRCSYTVATRQSFFMNILAIYCDGLVACLHVCSLAQD